MFQILNKEGNVVNEEFEPKLEEDDLKHIYYNMVLTRAADDKCLKLQRQGRMGTYPQGIGHEACQVGSAHALKEEDWIFPYFRDLGAYLVRGLPLKNYFLYWMGHEEGMRIPGELRIFTVNIPVASHLPHSVGYGMAANIRKEKLAIVSYFGDGGTSQGDFHEALNFAGVFKTPNVFICYNNQYAISVPRSRQSASKTLAQKAIAYGLEGIQVDGNDALAMYSATAEALDKARKGGGPTLIEAYTYRIGDHTTSDDAKRYRTDEELKSWMEKDPIERFKKYLAGKGIWSDELEKEFIEEAGEAVSKAVEEAEATPPPEPGDAFIYIYAEMPPHLEGQLGELKEFLGRK
ncbi:MAG: pyruvate dehydrogenase (acetyl-transferring) E1 component subunit alpha [Candidatus Hydrothermarchaeaceae archaeon]